jgi:hypothetical protein
MRVLVRPTAEAAAFDGWCVRRNWIEGHEFVSYRLSYDEAMEAALLDQRGWAVDIPGQVAHAVVPINVVVFELHADGALCASPDCPPGIPLPSLTALEAR